MSQTDDWVLTPPPDAPPNPEATLVRLRALARIKPKSKWSSSDLGLMVTWHDWGKKVLTERFRGEVAESIETIHSLAQGVDLKAAEAELRTVVPVLDRLETMSDLREAILTLEGLEATAFDTYRMASSLLIAIDDSVDIWNDIWGEMSIADSKAAAASELNSELRDIFYLRRRLRMFTRLYEVTMMRVRSLYEKVSRIVAIEQSLMGMKPISRGPEAIDFDAPSLGAKPRRLFSPEDAPKPSKMTWDNLR